MGAHRNPKVARLRRLAGLSRMQAVGALELLWLFAMEQSPRGDIGKWSDEDIEEACDWHGESGALVAALVECKWLDKCPEYRLVVHDWLDHAPRWLKERWRRNPDLAPQRGAPCHIVPHRGDSQEKPSQEKPSDAKRGKGESEGEVAGAPARSPSKILCPAWDDERWTRARIDRIAAYANTLPGDKPSATASIARVREWSEEKTELRTMRGWEATVRRAIRENWAGAGEDVRDTAKAADAIRKRLKLNPEQLAFEKARKVN